MAGSSQLRPPAGLAARGRALWRRITETYELDGIETELLTELCRAVDQCDRIRAELSKAELLVPGSRGQTRPNPLLTTLSTEVKLVDRLAGSLGVSMPGASGAGKGRGHQAKAARCAGLSRSRLRAVRDAVAAGGGTWGRVAVLRQAVCDGG